jgi:hypothetical protein
MTGRRRKWSGKVSREGDALDGEKSIFDLDDPRRIARSLKRAAELSRRHKSDPLRSAMSMLNSYVSRAGEDLPEERLKTLDATRHRLRQLFHRELLRRGKPPPEQ